MKMILRNSVVLCLVALGSCAATAGARAADESLSTREERAMKAAVARVAPSVVRIETVGGLERVGQVLIGTGPTTGLIVSPEGHIVSSAFNFVQKPDSILITLPDGPRLAAKLVATDHSRMLVLLKVESEAKLPVPEAVPQSEMRVGQWALAVGRTFEVREPNVSVGIVSALGRIWGKAVQTDAKISPNNYGGPLIDISGRVLGVLVPMSPDGNAEMAGVEWYDSGIGFAIPLETIQRVLPKMIEGNDLHPGLLGIAMKSTDIYAQPADIAAARATGPAYKAGFRSGDKIVEVAGRPVTRQAELKQQLGAIYAGEKVKLVALRGTERIEREVELADKIAAYEFPFLGVLPLRGPQTDDGVIVRHVYPDSPAAMAGAKPGDKIVSLAGQKITKLDELVQQFQNLLADEKVKFEVRRGDETLALEVALARLPESLPGELPPAHGTLPASEEQLPPRGVVSFKVPEFPNDCLGYVPENYDPRVPCGLVVWLHPPGGDEQEELLNRWKPLCEQYGFVLVAPKSTERGRWQPTEVRFVRRMVEDAMKKYAIDPARVVAHGHQGGGAMAYLFAFSSPEVVRAVAAVDAPLPRLVQPPETDPVQRLAIYTTLANKSEIAPAVEAGIKRLRDLKYPVVVKEVGEQGRYLTDEELAELMRWFDSLDRL